MLELLKRYWPFFAIPGIVLLALLVAINIMIPDPSHRAFAQSGGGADIRPLVFVLLCVAVIGYVGKSLWNSHTDPRTNR